MSESFIMEFMEEERRQSEEYARISLGMANLIISTTGIMGMNRSSVSCQLIRNSTTDSAT